jgi:hypothetical protein
MSTATRRRRKPVEFTRADLAVAARYRAAKPDALGDIHERMKAVIGRAREIALDRIDKSLWHAIHDLQAEVSFHEPASPPYGHRFHKREAS